MQAIILAGGKGERLRPLTKRIPKLLIPLAGRPFYYFQIRWLKKYGIKDIIFSIGYLKQKVKKAIFKNKPQDVRIRFVEEKHPLGTAGAVRNAARLLKEKDFLVLNGDILTNFNLMKIINYHRSKNSLLTISLSRLNQSKDYGLVSINREGKIKSFSEKNSLGHFSGLINAGVYVFNKKILRYIPKNTNYSFETQFVPEIIRKGLPIYGLEISGYWLDVGTLSRYRQAKRDIIRLYPEF